MANGFLVTEAIPNAHRTFQDYPLLPDDLLTRSEDGTWFKQAPGLGIGGFVLTEEQVAGLKEVQFESKGLTYHIHE